MAEGFLWTCCDKAGDDRGCMSTKHKAKINMIVGEAPAMTPNRGQKRKADDDMSNDARVKRYDPPYIVHVHADQMLGGGSMYDHSISRTRI